MSDDIFSDEPDEYQELQKRNEDLIEAFLSKLESQGMSSSTVDRHYTNIYFFLIIFMFNHYGTSAEKGIRFIPEFMTDFFIRRAMWATEKTLNSMCATLNKFYQFLHERGEITKGDMAFAQSIIKYNRQDWVETLLSDDEDDGNWHDIF